MFDSVPNRSLLAGRSRVLVLMLAMALLPAGATAEGDGGTVIGGQPGTAPAVTPGPAPAPTQSAPTTLNLPPDPGPATGAPEECLAAPDVTRQIAVQDDSEFAGATDPVFKDSYPHAVKGLVQENDAWQTRFRVCYQEGGHGTAIQVADLLCRCFCYGRERLAPFGSYRLEAAVPGQKPPVVDFFLDNENRGGGKEQNGVMYLFKTLAPRHPVELARIVAHEFSHLSVPAIRGFGPPEDSANGYLGEVLYLGWLGEDTKENVLPVDQVAAWANARENAFIDKFLQIGPTTLLDRPTHYFWAFEGMLLYLKQMYGFPVLAKVLYNPHMLGGITLQDVSNDVGYIVQAAYKANSISKVTVPGFFASQIGFVEVNSTTSADQTKTVWKPHKAGSLCVVGPGQGVRCWVYLESGSHQIGVTAQEDLWELRGAVIGADDEWSMLGTVNKAAPVIPFKAAAEGWYQIQWRNTGDRPVTIQDWTWMPVQ